MSLVEWILIVRDSSSRVEKVTEAPPTQRDNPFNGRGRSTSAVKAFSSLTGSELILTLFWFDSEFYAKTVLDKLLIGKLKDNAWSKTTPRFLTALFVEKVVTFKIFWPLENLYFSSLGPTIIPSALLVLSIKKFFNIQDVMSFRQVSSCVMFYAFCQHY